MADSTLEDYTEGYEEQELKIPEKELDRLVILDRIASDALGKREEAVLYRAGQKVERRWKEDEELYTSEKTWLNIPIDKNILPRSKASLNVVQGRTEIAIGRFSDIVLPIGGTRNHSLKPTPNPEINKKLLDRRKAMQGGKQITDKQGKPATISDVTKDQMEIAEKAMKAMEQEINDKLTECDWNGEQRKAMEQAARLGTGILKGPSVLQQIGQTWVRITDHTGSTWDIDYEEQMVPESSFVDCRKVFPSPGTTRNIQKTCEYIWEVDSILRRNLENLTEVKTYEKYQVYRVLSEAPKRHSLVEGKFQERTEETSTSYETWIAVIDVNKEWMEKLGFSCQFAKGQLVSTIIYFVNDRIVKIDPNPDRLGRIPYDFFQWATLDINSPWGIGIPRQCYWVARILDAATRQMMDNATDSAGGVTVIHPDLKPMDGGPREMGGGRRVYSVFPDDSGSGQQILNDISKAIYHHQIQNNQRDYEAIIELALRFVDLVTSIPMVFQGEMQKIPETLGATNIVVDAANVALRYRVKLWFDRVLEPHLTRYYDWMMLYSDKEEIKGDYQVDVRNVNDLMERDQNAQIIAGIMQFKGDPDWDREINWEKAIRQFLEYRRLDVGRTEEERQNYQPPEPPMPEAIQVAQINAEKELQIQDMRNQIATMELQQRALEYAEKNKLDYEKVWADLQKAHLKKQADDDKLKVQLALQESNTVGPQLTAPPTEPAGRAPDGQAYQK